MGTVPSKMPSKRVPGDHDHSTGRLTGWLEKAGVVVELLYLELGALHL